MGSRGSIMVIAALAVLLVAPETRADDLGAIRMSAFAVSMGTVAPGSNAVVDLSVDHWSAVAERTRLIAALAEKGPDAALRDLQKLPVKGRFRIPGLMGPDPSQLRMGHDIRYAFQTPLEDGGHRIVLITDRYIGFREARDQPRTMDYPFTLIEIRVNGRGEGQGKMSIATRIAFDKKDQRLELENWSSEPVRLNKVTLSGRK